jgi:peptidoglycan/xylan/chitin deacetylase (PgdA/CDA1 family)
MEILRKLDYEVITFSDLVLRERFSDGKKKVILTFDDGYVDNYRYAFPVLKKYGYRAVIYLVSHLDYNKWDVENPKNPEKRFELMNELQLREMLDYGIEFGGHTKTHPRLSALEHEEARKEIFESKLSTEEKLGLELVSFAYPYGDLNEEVKELVKEAGYRYGVATDSGPVCISEDLYQIRRIGIFPNISKHGFKRKINGNYNFIKIKREEKKS